MFNMPECNHAHRGFAIAAQTAIHSVQRVNDIWTLVSIEQFSQQFRVLLVFLQSGSEITLPLGSISP
jgi:hypothetical protein